MEALRRRSFFRSGSPFVVLRGRRIHVSSFTTVLSRSITGHLPLPLSHGNQASRDWQWLDRRSVGLNAELHPAKRFEIAATSAHFFTGPSATGVTKNSRPQLTPCLPKDLLPTTAERSSVVFDIAYNWHHLPDSQRHPSTTHYSQAAVTGHPGDFPGGAQQRASYYSLGPGAGPSLHDLSHVCL